MSHVTEGSLRAFLDGETSAPGGVDAHLAECPACRLRLATVARDRDWMASVLGPVPVAPVDPAQTWRRLASTWFPAQWQGRRTDRRLRWTAGVLAGLALGTLGFEPVRADLALVLRPTHTQVITVSPTAIAQLEAALEREAPSINIQGVAQISTTGTQAREVSITQAQALLPFPLRLPVSAPGPASAVTVRASGTVTFRQLNVPAINGMLASLGDPAPLPASLADAVVTVDIPASATLTYGLAGSGSVRLIEAELPEVSVLPETADVAAVRQTILDLPLLPADLRAQLAAIPDWQSTLPLPQIAGESTAETVNGHPGLFLRNTGVSQSTGGRTPTASAALVWLDGDVVYAVQGPITLTQAMDLATSLSEGA